MPTNVSKLSELTLILRCEPLALRGCGSPPPAMLCRRLGLGLPLLRVPLLVLLLLLLLLVGDIRRIWLDLALRAERNAFLTQPCTDIFS